MSELNDKDWELLNAYHDDELSETDRRRVDLRLVSEPALASALRDVAGVSASLAALRPDIARTPGGAPPAAANSNRTPRRWLAGGAVAVAIALAVVIGIGKSGAPTARDIHAAFGEQSFSAQGDAIRLAGSDMPARAPDLSMANLTPVSQRTLDAGQVTHYTGRNGCRLSYFRGSFALDNADRPATYQVEEWTGDDNLRHLIVASGMDQARFEAIALYLRHVTGPQGSNQVMADAQLHRRPCLG
ncbi:hypothetical protein [Microbulbifer sp. S227A]|uniref:hypothetical protein n=1 Tax=Microbulbifer sp. S227A TaxID=3415131 RepID=UPI003C79F5DA